MGRTLEKESPALPGLLTTEERIRTITGPDGKPVEVALMVVPRRSGGFAFYRDGTGPFHSNRAARRGHFRGVEGHHDGSKKPTKGRVSREGWRGAPL